MLKLLDTLWKGNKSAMARDVGLSHSVINKVAYGQQLPGRKFLRSLADHPKISEEWLFTGKGEPFAQRFTPVEGLDLLPITDHPLPGSPVDYPGHLLGTMQLLAQEWVRPSRYLLRLKEGAPILDDREARVAVDDLLLIETDPIWIEQPQVLDQKTVVIRVERAGISELQLGRASLERVSGKPPKLTVDNFMNETFVVEPPRDNGSLEHGNRPLEWPEDGSSPARSAIAGLVVMLLRT